MRPEPAPGVPLAPLTTFELGGPARAFVEAGDEATAKDALRWAAEEKLPAVVLGGGSNVVIADRGIDALVIRMAGRGVELRREHDAARLTVAAGEPWEQVVELAVAERLAGLECLAGIPGLGGAVPIQNVGAYGQEVSETIERVRVLERSTLRVVELEPAACDFSYRDSLFRREPDRYVVLAVTFALRPGGAPAVRYPELVRALAGRAAPSLQEVRETVLSLRRAKSMVIDRNDENRRSAGSFFTNPVLPDAEAERVVARALSLGVAKDAAEVPRFAGSRPGTTKLAAGWLIERAGLARGLRRGAVGISTRHALALVHHGGGTSAELIELARHVRDTVERTFGVTLRPEPVMLGFDSPPV